MFPRSLRPGFRSGSDFGSQQSLDFSAVRHGQRRTGAGDGNACDGIAEAGRVGQ